MQSPFFTDDTQECPQVSHRKWSTMKTVRDTAISGFVTRKREMKDRAEKSRSGTELAVTLQQTEIEKRLLVKRSLKEIIRRPGFHLSREGKDEQQ